MYVMIQSKMQKDHKEVVVLLHSFEDYGFKTKEEEQRKLALVKIACPFILVHRKEIFYHMFHDPVACYMESFNNQNLQLLMGCKIRDEDEATIVFLLGFSRSCTSRRPPALWPSRPLLPPSKLQQAP